MHILTQSNNLGGALGSLIPAYQVSSGADIPYMLLWQGVAGTAILVFTFFLAPFRPPIHAEIDAVKQDKIRSSIDLSNLYLIFKQMLIDFYKMFQSFNFILLFLSFSIQVGISWVFMAVVGQMIAPCGYNITVVGNALSGLGFAGIVGSFCVAWILRNYKNYLFMQKFTIFVSAMACIWCLAVNSPGNSGLVIAAWIFYGFITGPLTPITLEHAAEMTWPIPADNSAALLFTGVNLVFLAVTEGVTPLLTDNVSMNCSSILAPSSILMFWFVLLGAFTVLPLTKQFYRSELKPVMVDDHLNVVHHKEEAEENKLEEDGDGVGPSREAEAVSGVEVGV